jgi:hypothetical protein
MMIFKRKSEKSKSLSRLASAYGTDKVQHNYIPLYERHFGARRDSPLTLLEIGIGSGGSLQMWRDYLPRATIIGIDSLDKSAFESSRIRVYQGDQADPAFLHRVAAENGGVDIVIDDGSHVGSDLLASFRTLFPLLKRGGLYVIEDMHTSYWSGFGGNFRDLNTGATSTSFVKTLIDGLNCHWIPGYAPSDLDLSIDALHCYPKIAFISKGENPKRLRPFEERMMEESLRDASDPAASP